MTISKALFPDMSVAAKVAMAVAGSLAIAVAAQVSVPMLPVPMTLQTLAVLVVGLAYGARLGAVTLLVYLGEGAAGLPVFAGGASGLPYMLGPTGGYLVGFVAAAALAGWAVDRGWAQGFPRTVLVALTAAALLYLPGLLWLTFVTPLDFGGAVKAGMLPFVPGDIVKAVLAALIVSGGWAALRARRG